MNSDFLKNGCFTQSLSLFVFSTFVIGCGAVGSPIPPEDVGIEAKVRKQQQENTQSERARAENGTISADEEGVELPALYPIGTR
jgi:hypothetical protein